MHIRPTAHLIRKLFKKPTVAEQCSPAAMFHLRRKGTTEVQVKLIITRLADSIGYLPPFVNISENGLRHYRCLAKETSVDSTQIAATHLTFLNPYEGGEI